MDCSICKDKINGKYGHNAQPINNGRCCDNCNNLVIIARLSYQEMGVKND